jgi:hypothetical protein
MRTVEEQLIGPPVVLGLEEVELLLDAIDGLADRQLERRSLRSLGKQQRLCFYQRGKTWN